VDRKGIMNQIPVEAQYIYRKAIEFEQRGKHETALNYLRQAVTIAPRFSKAFNELGNCLCALGRQREALVKYEKAIAIDPGFSEARRNRDSILRGQDGNLRI
jgi:tetratricopeptide (TPR) repeat protein